MSKLFNLSELTFLISKTEGSVYIRLKIGPKEMHFISKIRVPAKCPVGFGSGRGGR